MTKTLQSNKPNKGLGSEVDAESVPSSLRIVCDDASSISLQAAEAAEEGKPALRKFSMVAYTGGAMRLGGWPYPVVVDLAGMRVTRKSRPILKDHDRASIVGHTDDIMVGDSRLEVAGVISGVGNTAQEVIATSENGFPWQASLGANADKVVFIPEGKSATANSREFKGPVYIARKSTLGEVSFVALGADDDTTAKLEAGGVRPEEEDAEDPEEDMEELEPVNASLDLNKSLKSQASGLSPVQKMRIEAAAESKRISGIRKVCAGKHPEIEARAIEEGWSVTKTELAVLRIERPKAPDQQASQPMYRREVLEAACCLSVGLDETKLLKAYGERTLNSADPLRHIGLRELVAECARLEGHDIPRVFGDGAITIRAGFSTMSLPGILENVMNKTLLAAYENTPIAAFDLCSVGTVSDFKEVSRFRLLGTGGFEKVAPDGELKHGKMSEQKYSNKADTYGQLLMLTRQDIINDDLNAFMDIPRQMGRSGAESIDDLFFTLLLGNIPAFFSSTNSNLITGVDSVFSANSLTKAKTNFRKQKAGPGNKAKDQKPINIRPEFLVVPVELETDAELLMGSAQLMIDAQGQPTKIPVDNPHRNKYRVISTPHLSDAYYPGASAKAWYLFANPNVLPAFEIVFLNGRRTPVIERVEMPPNMLGMGFRSFIDFGVNSQDPRAAVKVTGEAA
jgi:hypothetical protein